jgi:hypothetical protein
MQENLPSGTLADINLTTRSVLLMKTWYDGMLMEETNDELKEHHCKNHPTQGDGVPEVYQPPNG